jgi:hypothetical protein
MSMVPASGVPVEVLLLASVLLMVTSVGRLALVAVCRFSDLICPELSGQRICG